MDFVNGASIAVAVNGTQVAPGAVLPGVDFRTAVLTTAAGKKLTPLKAVLSKLFQCGTGTTRSWAAVDTPKGGPSAAFFLVARPGTAAPAVLFATDRATAPQTGFYSPGPGSPLAVDAGLAGLQFFAPTRGATIPAGFVGAAGLVPAAPAVPAAPVLAHTTLSPAQRAAYDATFVGAEILSSCDPAMPVELFSLHRLFSNVKLAQAQGGVAPLRVTGPDGVTALDYSVAAATAQAPGLASRAACGGDVCKFFGSSASATLADLGAATGTTIVAAPPRPEEVVRTQSSFSGDRSKEFFTHPLAAVPATNGQSYRNLNLAPVSDTAACRAADVKRYNAMLDRLVDLRLKSAETL
jgi:hypothetical protein